MKPKDIYSQIVDIDKGELGECEPDMMIWFNAPLLIDLPDTLYKAGDIILDATFQPSLGIVTFYGEDNRTIATFALKLTIEPITES